MTTRRVRMMMVMLIDDCWSWDILAKPLLKHTPNKSLVLLDGPRLLSVFCVIGRNL